MLQEIIEKKIKEIDKDLANICMYGKSLYEHFFKIHKLTPYNLKNIESCFQAVQNSSPFNANYVETIPDNFSFSPLSRELRIQLSTEKEK